MSTPNPTPQMPGPNDQTPGPQNPTPATAEQQTQANSQQYAPNDAQQQAYTQQQPNAQQTNAEANTQQQPAADATQPNSTNPAGTYATANGYANGTYFNASYTNTNGYANASFQSGPAYQQGTSYQQGTGYQTGAGYPNYQQGAGFQAVPPYSNNGGQIRRFFKQDRSFVAWFFLNLITGGIYGLVVMYFIVDDVNEICSPRDGKKTHSYLLMVFLFSWLTLGIYPLVWWHGFSDRVGDALQSRGYPRMLSAGTFWGWKVLGSLILVGPWIFDYKMLQAVNTLAADANNRGI